MKQKKERMKEREEERKKGRKRGEENHPHKQFIPFLFSSFFLSILIIHPDFVELTELRLHFHLDYRSVLPIRHIITSTTFLQTLFGMNEVLSKILNFFFAYIGIASTTTIQNFVNFAAGDERQKCCIHVPYFSNISLI